MLTLSAIVVGSPILVWTSRWEPHGGRRRQLATAGFLHTPADTTHALHKQLHKSGDRTAALHKRCDTTLSVERGGGRARVAARARLRRDHDLLDAAFDG